MSVLSEIEKQIIIAKTIRETDEWSIKDYYELVPFDVVRPLVEKLEKENAELKEKILFYEKPFNKGFLQKNIEDLEKENIELEIKVSKIKELKMLLLEIRDEKDYENIEITAVLSLIQKIGV